MADQEHEDYHPGAAEYVQIGVILAVITAIEVALFYTDAPRIVTVPSLLGLTVMKFALVVLWFMHLRFDSRWFRRLFFGGVALAIVIYTITVATF